MKWGKNLEVKKKGKQRCFKKTQIQNQVAKTQNMVSHRRRYAINRDNDLPPVSWDSCWEAEAVQGSPRFSCSGPISRYYANRRTREACPIDCMETLGNIYGNGSRHVTQRVKLTATLNWESLFIPPWLSSCRSTNSPVGMNPHRRWSCCWTASTSSLRL
jgi:hypothetical protein